MHTVNNIIIQAGKGLRCTIHVLALQSQAAKGLNLQVSSTIAFRLEKA